MKKAFFTLLLTALFTSSQCNADIPISNSACTKVELTCQIVNKGNIMDGPHRTPPLAPVVFHDRDSGMLCFSNPCYDTSLELVIPGSDAVVYECDIPDGSETIELPTYLSGEYELRIIRGSWCFCGTILL